MRLTKFAAAIAVALAAPVASHAATLSLSLTADNEFKVYLSSSNSVLGNLIGSGNAWWQAYNFSTPLNPGTNYIHIIGTNWTSASGHPDFGSGNPNGQSPNPNALLGEFTIFGTGYQFPNHSTSLLTGPGYILGIGATDNTTWTTPTTLVQVFSPNGGNNIWTNNLGGPVSGISTAAQWVWSNPDNAQYADFSIEITDPLPTPLPAALPLFAGGLGVLGYLAGRRKRKVAPAIAAA